MKVFTVALLCAIAGGVAGSSVAWPGAVAISSPYALPSPVALSSPFAKTYIPGVTKTSAYSTTQYLNAIPAPYSFGVHQQFAIPLPQTSGFASIQPGYYPVAGSPFVSAPNVYYPSQAFTPIVSGFGPASIIPGNPAAPGVPSPGEPSNQDFPSGPSNQLPGDADSAVIESADSNPEQGRQEIPAAAPPAPPSSGTPASPSHPPSQPSPPASTFPNFPAFPQIPQGTPSFPPPQNLPQIPQNLPQIPQNLPQIPQNLPQAPQIPGFPQFPQVPSNLFPQGPSQAPPSNFPSAINNDQGLNDEDTISVESA